ncbi:MAG: MBOAT family O-acyltransferase [Myxococcota bacterium]
MVFSSLLFIFAFLPAFFALYYLTPAKLKNAVALIASVLFYSWGAANVLGILVVGLVIDYLLARAIHRTEPDSEQAIKRRKILLAVSVVINVGALLYYKYSNFAVAQVNLVSKWLGGPQLHWAEVLLPVGISFFTFHKISYVVDVYRKTSPPTKDFVTFALYVLFFPQLIAGPIIRYHDVAEALASRRHRLESISYGAFRFCMGLAKKALVANQLAITADLVFAQNPSSLSSFNAWLGVLCYTFQIYLDFSGYSDMALGLGHMVGIRFKENFDCPYRSTSVTEFWRRWHISLSSWMKEYLYVPLGGNRVSPRRTYINLWIVFLISGLWHGANWTFVVWGAYHGSFLVIEKLFALRWTQKLPKLVSAAITFLIVVVGWVFFRAPGLDYAARLLGRMSGLTQYVLDKTSLLPAEIMTYRGATALVIAIIISFLPLTNFGARLAERYENPESTLPVACFRYATALVCMVLSCATLANSAYNPFIYFRF